MRILVNDQERDIANGATIADLLEELEVAVPHVAVELNLNVIPRDRHGEVLLSDGDRLEIVTLVGGG